MASIALHKAIISGRIQQVRYLTESHDIDVNAKDRNKKTPLMLCCELEPENTGLGIAKVLLSKGAEVATVDARGENLLMYACRLGRRSIVDMLLSEGNCRLNQQDDTGYTALHHVALTGEEYILSQLIENHQRYGITVDTRDKLGQTALILAAKHGHLGCARLLVVRGNASLTIRDNESFRTAVEWAQSSSRKCRRSMFSADLPKDGSINHRQLERMLSAGAAEVDPERLPTVDVKRPNSTSFMTIHEARNLQLLQSDTLLSLQNPEFKHPRNLVQENLTKLYGVYYEQHSPSYRLQAEVVSPPIPSPEPTEEDESSATTDAEIGSTFAGRLKKFGKFGKRQSEAQKRLNHLTTTAQTVTAMRRKAKSSLHVTHDSVHRPRTPKKTSRNITPEQTSSDGEKSNSPSPSNSVNTKMLRAMLVKRATKHKRMLNQMGKSEESFDSGEHHRTSSAPNSRPTSSDSVTSSGMRRKSHPRRKDPLLSIVTSSLQVIQSESELTPEPSPTKPSESKSNPRNDSGFESDSPTYFQIPHVKGSPTQVQENVEPVGQTENSAKQTRPKSAKTHPLLRRSSSKRGVHNSFVKSSRENSRDTNDSFDTDGTDKNHDHSNDRSPPPKQRFGMIKRHPSLLSIEREHTDSGLYPKSRYPEVAQSSPAFSNDGAFRFPKGFGSGDLSKRPHSQAQVRSLAYLAELDARIMTLKQELKQMKKKRPICSHKVKDSPRCPSSPDNSVNDINKHSQRIDKHITSDGTVSRDGKHNEQTRPDNGKDCDVINRNEGKKSTLRRRGTKPEVELAECRKAQRDHNNSESTRKSDITNRKEGKAKRHLKKPIVQINDIRIKNEDFENVTLSTEKGECDEDVIIQEEEEREAIEQQKKIATRVLAARLKHPAYAPSRVRHFPPSKNSSTQNIYTTRRGKRTLLKLNPSMKIYMTTESNPLSRANRMPSVGQKSSRTVRSQRDAYDMGVPSAVKSLFRGK